MWLKGVLDSFSETTVLGSSSKWKKFPESDYDATKKGECPMSLFSLGYLSISYQESPPPPQIAELGNLVLIK